MSVTLGENHGGWGFSATAQVAHALVQWGEQAAAVAGMGEVHAMVTATEGFNVTLTSPPEVDPSNAAHLAALETAVENAACLPAIVCNIAQASGAAVPARRRLQVAESYVVFRIHRTLHVSGNEGTYFANLLRASISSSILAGNHVNATVRMDMLSASLTLSSSVHGVGEHVVLVQALSNMDTFLDALNQTSPLLASYSWQIAPVTILAMPLPPSSPPHPLPPQLASPNPSPPQPAPLPGLPPVLPLISTTAALTEGSGIDICPSSDSKMTMTLVRLPETKPFETLLPAFM